MLVTVLLVAVGGGVGSVARFVITGWVQGRAHSGFPWGTYVVNATGSLLIGVVFGLVDGAGLGGEAALFLTVGLLGGYTTFSTFSFENLRVLQYGSVPSFLHNAAGQVVIGLALAWCGYWLGVRL
jgi:fluoride exporter